MNIGQSRYSFETWPENQEFIYFSIYLSIMEAVVL